MPQNLEHQIYTEVRQLREHQKTQRAKKAALIFFIAIFTGLTYYWTRNQAPTPLSIKSTTSTPEPSFPPVERPLSGAITPTSQGDSAFGKLRLFLSPPTKSDNSTLKNQCPANTALKKNDLNYFLKVIDVESSQTVMTAFIRAGEKVTLNVPAGTYKLRYAAGEQWYGEEHLFGTKTRYGEVYEFMGTLPLQFKFEPEGTGWDLGLYRCSAGGNTSTKALKPEDF